MTITTLLTITGLSQRAFGEKYNIPKRTIENWSAGVNTPPEYVLSLLERAVKEDFADDWKTIMRIYDRLDMDIESLDNDIEHDYLTRNRWHNGRDVIWYCDAEKDLAISIPDATHPAHTLTEREIEEELL